MMVVQNVKRRCGGKMTNKMRKYSPRQQTLTVDGKKVKQLDKESRSQYWDRIKKLRQDKEAKVSAIEYEGV